MDASREREEWRDIPGYEGLYQASNLGRIKGCQRRVPRGSHYVTVAGRMMRSSLSHPTRGHLQLILHANGIPRSVKVHQLVAWTFIGPTPDGMQIRHLNGINTDNRAVNLAFGTHQDNMDDLRRHATHSYRKKTHCPRGHPYSGDNLYLHKEGWRDCRKCRNLSTQKSKQRRQCT